MKSFFTLVIGTAITLSAMYANAFEDYGIEAGFRSQNFSIDSTSATAKTTTGYQLGITGAQQLSGPFYLRTGLMYSQRPLSYDSTAAGSYKLKLTYFDIPLTFGYKFEYAMIYAGPTLSVKLSDDVENTTGLTFANAGASGTIVPLSLGAAFRFAPQIGANVFFEMTTSNAATSMKDLRAVGANIIFYLD